MDTENLPSKKYYLKKAENQTLANIISIITLMFFTGFFIYIFLISAAFIPLLHIPILLIMLLLALLTYYIKVPPPYVKIDGDKIKVRRTLIGGWDVINSQDIEASAVRGNSLFLVSLADKPREIEIKLSRLSFKDAEELQNLLT